MGIKLTSTDGKSVYINDYQAIYQRSSYTEIRIDDNCTIAVREPLEKIIEKLDAKKMQDVRDKLAQAALTGLLSGGDSWSSNDCYLLADEIMATRGSDV